MVSSFGAALLVANGTLLFYLRGVIVLVGCVRPVLYPLPDPIGDDVTLPVECPPPGGFVPPWLSWCDHGYLGASAGCYMLEGV